MSASRLQQRPLYLFFCCCVWSRAARGSHWCWTVKEPTPNRQTGPIHKSSDTLRILLPTRNLVRHLNNRIRAAAATTALPPAPPHPQPPTHPPSKRQCRKWANKTQSWVTETFAWRFWNQPFWMLVSLCSYVQIPKKHIHTVQIQLCLAAHYFVS